MTQGWSSFYSVLGEAAAGLIGLIFIVITLTSTRGRPSSLRAAGLYLTPTILHFGATLAVSAVLEMPDLTPPRLAVALGLIAVAGLACCLRSAAGILRTPDGPPHWSDFWLYAGAPAALYAVLLAAAYGAWKSATWALGLTAATLLVLLLLAVRNAWDTITWIAAGGVGDQPRDPDAP